MSYEKDIDKRVEGYGDKSIYKSYKKSMKLPLCVVFGVAICSLLVVGSVIQMINNNFADTMQDVTTGFLLLLYIAAVKGAVDLLSNVMSMMFYLGHMVGSKETERGNDEIAKIVKEARDIRNGTENR